MFFINRSFTKCKVPSWALYVTEARGEEEEDEEEEEEEEVGGGGRRRREGGRRRRSKRGSRLLATCTA